MDVMDLAALNVPQRTARMLAGQVVSVDTATALVTVQLADENYVLPARGPIGSYAANQYVTVESLPGGQSTVIAPNTVPAAAPAPPPPPTPDPDPPKPLRRFTARPFLDTYTTARGWRGLPDLYQGDYSGNGRHTGCAFYGNAIAALNADLTHPRRATLTVQRDQGGGSYAAQQPTLWVIAERSRPGGAPTRSQASLAIPALLRGQAVTVDLPAGHLDALLAGSAGGLAIHVDAPAPYIKLAGAWPGQFVLDISYYPA